MLLGGDDDTPNGGTGFDFLDGGLGTNIFNEDYSITSVGVLL